MPLVYIPVQLKATLKQNLTKTLVLNNKKRTTQKFHICITYCTSFVQSHITFSMCM